ncbi:MAG: hypothetical protein WAW06_06155 [bacterium]
MARQESPGFSRGEEVNEISATNSGIWHWKQKLVAADSPAITAYRATMRRHAHASALENAAAAWRRTSTPTPEQTDALVAAITSMAQHLGITVTVDADQCT